MYTNKIDKFDRHEKDQYYNGKHKVNNYYGNAYTCYFI